MLTIRKRWRAGTRSLEGKQCGGYNKRNKPKTVPCVFSYSSPSRIRTVQPLRGNFRVQIPRNIGALPIIVWISLTHIPYLIACFYEFVTWVYAFFCTFLSSSSCVLRATCSVFFSVLIITSFNPDMHLCPYWCTHNPAHMPLFLFHLHLYCSIHVYVYMHIYTLFPPHHVQFCFSSHLYHCTSTFMYTLLPLHSHLFSICT